VFVSERDTSWNTRSKAGLSYINAFQGMEMPKPQANMPHIENVRLVKDATASGAGVTGFNGRIALLPLGIALLAAFVAIAYLFV
jgi:hypothetical protein